MAVPGLGTVVRYHVSTGVDIVGFVITTSAMWNSDMAIFYGNSGPATGHVDLLTWQDSTNSGGIQLVRNVTEGSAVGEFSLLAAETEDS